ncbi:hypothetical protein M758_7G182200 [Ceratodon purpureus]|uniref:Retroviral polymerase SH3-like domain-containing protein n=1 Tax=Ceratodon purpureus TaxID=3225 RepID=A0A8T0HCC5_CERPU|nr:hypothetical protein KC19_7G184600 [Ceratodon purpureus]KAG0611997.1 hypothetical protein M758_7G182200 [Ceratodon purpureus]
MIRQALPSNSEDLLIVVLHLWIYGCRAYVYIPQEKISKLDVKSILCILAGYDE